jgi:hypothetical protein
MKNDTLNLHEDADVRMNIRGFWALIVAVFIAGGAVVTFQLKMDQKIDELYLRNKIEHEQLMVKLAEIGARQDFYALKRAVEDAFVFVNLQRDRLMKENGHGHTNELVVDELKFRMQIREFLK